MLNDPESVVVPYLEMVRIDSLLSALWHRALMQLPALEVGEIEACMAIARKHTDHRTRVELP